MAQSQQHDMGSGSINKWMVRLAVPAILGQLVNMLYSIVDRIYIGHIPQVGADALTGVGLFTPILMLITAFAMLCGAGGAPRAAIAMGKGDKETAEKIVGNCFTADPCCDPHRCVLFYRTGSFGLVRRKSGYAAFCHFLCPHLYSRQCFCTHSYGYEPLYHHPGFC